MARSAAQLSRTPGQWHDWEAEGRRRTLAALLAELRRAREQRADWYEWLRARAEGRHVHGLTDERGARIACPAAGCDHERGATTPHLPGGDRGRRAGRGQPTV